MTIADAIQALAEPRLAPLSATVRIGLRKGDEGGWDEIWIAPSFQHPGFFYATQITTSRDGKSSVAGLRRPVRDGDWLKAAVATLVDGEIPDLRWTDWPSVAWIHNVLLFSSPTAYVDSLDKRELIEIAEDWEPGDDFAFNAFEVSGAADEIADMVPLAVVAFGPEAAP